ncbi:hypothetical protein BJV85_002893 [Clostridium acetobutylicum]|uniref:Uncharacterized protein n=1 Tax=Clostridium acetobutylicum (strain ATCC 824 / DSM 792 / JCM 1419 / IAM 19013 / LMG 5710 / NBRC 13948 / NRRL B-527 / VKM B-1787 / 2291 / W) TaxID=272562 RepID=Q97K15_CLOAB|nr:MULTISPECIES: hypothetical protein [Clostridium]AAK79080.1 Hypothetical protein CA_C1106 [Clostridium acetobutylicum ATCC 824]ADZ20155.1 Conserved hypothetical protein [Clostridium acetobutylicum EA 2018]AEI31619.1 hypothetical protein SMB_G1124 [Clostridium acetobutylicum DSM 1731]AWV81666.1 hypothetical protein DK921_16525 [Clostridium acetobutylicum]MBC2393311.1 hypothetical protein [Clostridium acetobutylicum]
MIQTSGFYSYRATSTANQELLDFSKFTDLPSDSLRAKKIKLVPDTKCTIRINNLSYTCALENSFETLKEDFFINSLKIIEPNVGFYIQYFV